jgi:hypothetical protein
VIPARLQCAGRPTAERSRRIQMLAAGPSVAVIFPLRDRRSQSSMLDFANDVREMLGKGAGDGTGRE